MIKYGKVTKKIFKFYDKRNKFYKKTLGISKIEDIDKTVLKQLKKQLKALKDSWIKNKGIYKLWDVIIVL